MQTVAENPGRIKTGPDSIIKNNATRVRQKVGDIVKNDIKELVRIASKEIITIKRILERK